MWRSRKKKKRVLISPMENVSLCVCVCAYLEAPLLQVCDWVAGHFILQRLRNRLPGDGGDSLGFLGNLCFVVGEIKRHT